MFRLLIQVLLAACVTATLLESALTSPDLMRELFREYKSRQHRLYAGQQELNFRYNIFRASVARIAKINREQSSYTAGINFMADLTEAEREMHYGLNVTADSENRGLRSGPTAEITPVLPPESVEVDWTARNKVAPVKDQKNCGSCWAFSGTGSVESRYAVATGALKAMSDQEGLDCSYEDRKYDRDGCRGGWPRDVWNYIMNKRNHYSLESDYPYEAHDTKCRTSGKRTALTNAKLTSYQNLDKGDEHLIQALLSGAVSVAFKVRYGFNHYEKGIYVDHSCPKNTPTHAVLATGYGPDYITVKNSWGTDWGDKGYIKFARIGNMCGISGYASVPVFSGASPEDDPKCRDEHKDCGEWAEHCGTGDSWLFMATRCRKTCGMCTCDMDGCTLCKDSKKDCATWATEGYCEKPNYVDYMKQYCPVACNACPKEDEDDDDDDDKDDDDDRCGNGLVWCRGQCRHRHFC